MKRECDELSSKYFEYLATRFPVMCAGDEFHFMPRARSAARYFDRLDDLDRHTVLECVGALRQFKDECRRLAARTEELEEQIDLEVLRANMAGLSIELEQRQSWRHNPLLYLKIAFIGLDHALTKPAHEERERLERLISRMDGVPRLFRQAAENINTVPESYHRPSLAMARDCNEYLHEIADRPTGEYSRRLREASEKARHALFTFVRFLERLPPVPDRDCVVPVFAETLKDQFLSIRSPSEVFEIAREEWRENLDHLERLQAAIGGGRSWRELYHAYRPRDLGGGDLRDLYTREMNDLQRFFLVHGFSGVGMGRLPEIQETPIYLRSVRSSASFSAAFTRDSAERDIFYLTTRLLKDRSEEAGELLDTRLRRECKFLAAHEVFPGHYVLDSTRRMLENSVRSQVESPLFYEGWAYYVESLLIEYGYVADPMDQMVDRKRRLWRAARCMIDIGSATGSLGIEEALGLLTTAGFSKEEGKNQIDRFRLNPGYQLCYSLGRYEIVKLREAYGGRMGLDEFHRELLLGGEIPFHLAAKRLETLNRGNVVHTC